MSVIINFLRTLKYHTLMWMICLKSFYIHNFKKSKKAVYILSTPRHGNLGDQAIVYSQLKLFEELGIRKNVIEVNKDTFVLFKEKISKLPKRDDLIVIDGGGNMGTLWLDEECIIRDIITSYPENPIVIMPQTAYFEDTHYGKSELQKSIEVYCSHADLTVFSRDIDTYNLITSEFKTVKTLLVPDMVMFLSGVSKKVDRDGALLCLREDVEKTCSEDAKKEILQFLNDEHYNINETSTLVDHKVDFWQRKRTLVKKWEEFSSAEFVVTDRLHGMIFAAITATPCVVLDNVSHKVKNGYSWLSNLPYIVYCDNSERVIEDLKAIVKISHTEYTYRVDIFKNEYLILKNHLENKLRTK